MFTSDPGYFDSHNVEIICLYIHHHKVFNDILLDLNNNYLCSKKDDKICIEYKKFYNDKIDEFTNIKLICGMNGTGKTSLLELIHNPNGYPNVLLILKSNSTFISNRKIEILFNGQCYYCHNNYVGDLRYKLISPLPSELNEGNLNFYRGLLNFYVENKSLFDDIDKQLITDFSIEIWDDWENFSSIEDDIARKLNLYCQEFEVRNMIKNDFLSYIFYHSFGDSTFDDWISNNKIAIDQIINTHQSVYQKLIAIRSLLINGREENILNDLIKELNNLIYVDIIAKPKESSLKENLGDNKFFDFLDENIVEQSKNFNLSEFNDVISSFGQIIYRITTIFEEIYSKNSLHYWHDMLYDIFYFKPIKIFPDGTTRYLNEFSSGELQIIRLRHDLFKRMIQDDCSIILEDEPDAHLHPEWSRTFMLHYIKSVKEIRLYMDSIPEFRERKIKNKTFNIIMTTHSPIMLSDFFNKEVIFLKKDEGNVIECKNLTNCFAGNISEILLDNFFIQRTIGAYAEDEIKNIVKILNSNDQNQLKDNKDKIIFIISNIGDLLLKSILTDQYKRIFNENN